MKLFKVTYEMEHHIRRETHGGMDSEPTGIYETKTHHKYVAADASELAVAPFITNDIYKNIKVEEVDDDVWIVRVYTR